MGLRVSLRRRVRMRRRASIGRHWPRDVAGVLGDELRHPILDVGAHHGETVQEIRRFIAGTMVHAFEPVAASFAELERSAARFRSVRCHQLALSDRRGVRSMHISPRGSVHSSLEPIATMNADPPQTEEVRTIRLDEFLGESGIEAISVLKIDTEGHELSVLRGAGRLLHEGTFRSIVAEATFYPRYFHHASFFDLFRLLSDCGYRFAGLYGMHNLVSRRPRHQFCDALFLLESVFEGPALTPR